MFKYGERHKIDTDTDTNTTYTWGHIHTDTRIYTKFDTYTYTVDTREIQF